MSYCGRRCVVGRQAGFPVGDKRFVPRRTGPRWCRGTSRASREGIKIRSTRYEKEKRKKRKQTRESCCRSRNASMTGEELLAMQFEAGMNPVKEATPNVASGL